MRKDVETIGVYRVLRPIGKGGMAEVFAVEKTGPAGFEKQLCLKRIRREYADNIEFVESFESEARIVSRLQHPNIVQVFDFFRQDKDLCLVMELIDGMDLNRVLKLVNDFGLLLPVDVAIYILESLLLALQHAHHLTIKGEEVSVIHRDISPHNMLISTAGVVKLADFGIAKARGMSQQTKTGVLKGKLSYMSPEQLKGGGAPLGPESDLFAAGVVFWEMLAKERLFKATMEHQIFANRMNFEKAPIDHLHPRMNQFLEKILAPNPTDRFHSAREALDALKRIGVRPCSQDDIAQVVTALKVFKDLSLDHQKAKEPPRLSTLSKHQTELDGRGTETREEHGHDTSDVTEQGKTGVRDHRRFIPVIAAVIIAAILTGVVVVWRGLRDDEADTETDRETVRTVLSKEPPDKKPPGKPDPNPVKVLEAPTVASSPESQVLSPPAENSGKERPDEAPMLTEDRLKDETGAVGEERPVTPKRPRKRRVEKENPKNDNKKNRKLVPFGAD